MATQDRAYDFILILNCQTIIIKNKMFQCSSYLLVLFKTDKFTMNMMNTLKSQSYHSSNKHASMLTGRGGAIK